MKTFLTIPAIVLLPLYLPLLWIMKQIIDHTNISEFESEILGTLGLSTIASILYFLVVPTIRDMFQKELTVSTD